MTVGEGRAPAADEEAGNDVPAGRSDQAQRRVARGGGAAEEPARRGKAWREAGPGRSSQRTAVAARRKPGCLAGRWEAAGRRRRAAGEGTKDLLKPRDGFERQDATTRAVVVIPPPYRRRLPIIRVD